jgi:hypothetical protein
MVLKVSNAQSFKSSGNTSPHPTSWFSFWSCDDIFDRFLTNQYLPITSHSHPWASPTLSESICSLKSAQFCLRHLNFTSSTPEHFRIPTRRCGRSGIRKGFAALSVSAASNPSQQVNTSQQLDLGPLASRASHS